MAASAGYWRQDRNVIFARLSEMPGIPILLQRQIIGKAAVNIFTSVARKLQTQIKEVAHRVVRLISLISPGRAQPPPGACDPIGRLWGISGSLWTLRFQSIR